MKTETMKTTRSLITAVLAIALVLVVASAQTSTVVPVFTKSTQVFEGNINTWGTTLADLDADGDLDIVLATMFTPSLVLINDGKGRFEDSGQMLPDDMHDVAAGDIDLDGDRDLFFAPIRNQRCPVYVNDGHAAFEVSTLSVDASESVQLVDIENDGDLDAYLGKGSMLYLNDGKGRFSKSRLPIPDYSFLVDLNGDGVVDAIKTVPLKGFTVYQNDKNGALSEYSHTANSEMIIAELVSADLDNDGDVDVVYTDAGRNRDCPSGVLLNDGTGRLTDSGQRLSSATKYGYVATGDLNGDSLADIVISDWDNAARVWLSSGNGTFVDSGIRLGEGSGWTNCMIADLDNDGDMDVFMINRITGNHGIWFNQTP